MKVSLTAFYLVFSILLASLGAWMLIDPVSLLGQLHSGGALGVSALLGQQVALGLLLAAGVTLFCMARENARATLHVLVLLYLFGLVLSHGEVAFGAGAWMWLPVAIYALPLLLMLPLKLPRGSVALADGEERGEVKWFNPTKGFGFLLASDGREVFVHFRAVQNGGRRSLRQGQTVRFTTRQSERGEQADQVYIERD